ncbi:MAG: hypothetical protein KBG15_13585 [Kofleriaceae bacterium]|nr:hypothetical protein [Kofleriaceae bacterium]
MQVNVGAGLFEFGCFSAGDAAAANFEKGVVALQHNKFVFERKHYSAADRDVTGRRGGVDGRRRSVNA